jgi:hypothetical protein
MTPVAFCDRVSDLAQMTILLDVDGVLRARRRLASDRIVPTFQTGRFGDLWRHVKTQGRYVRHDVVYDMDLDPVDGVPCYDYSSMADGRLWLRTHASWHDVVDGTPRFEPLCDRAAASAKGRLN